MDLNQITSEIAQDEEAITVPVEDRRGAPYLAADGSPATISVLGSESKRVRQARDAQARRMMRTRRKLEPKDLRDNRIEIATASVTGWHGWETNGQPLACTPENVRSLLQVDHILQQVEEAAQAERADFTNSSPTS